MATRGLGVLATVAACSGGGSAAIRPDPAGRADDAQDGGYQTAAIPRDDGRDEPAQPAKPGQQAGDAGAEAGARAHTVTCAAIDGGTIIAEYAFPGKTAAQTARILALVATPFAPAGYTHQAMNGLLVKDGAAAVRCAQAGDVVTFIEPPSWD